MDAETTPLQEIFRAIKTADPSKEKARKYRRTVFDAGDWKVHRSSYRYFKALTSIPRSAVLHGLLNQTLLVTVTTAALVLYNLIAMRFRRLPVITIPALPFSLTSPSLGLLLVFRTNAAYARWTDARSSWSVVQARSWDLMRQGVSWLPTRELKAELVRHTAAFSRCLKWHCGDHNKVHRLEDDLSSILTTFELEGYRRARNKPQWSLLRIADIISRARLLPNVQSHMDKSIVALSAQLATCERIYTTPIPLVYTRHTLRFLFLWLVTTPMAMFTVFPPNMWLTIIPINFLQSMFLFGIEELGVQIEEPFDILALTRFTRQISSGGEDVLTAQGITWFGDEEKQVMAPNAVPVPYQLGPPTMEVEDLSANDDVASTVGSVLNLVPKVIKRGAANLTRAVDGTPRLAAAAATTAAAAAAATSDASSLSPSITAISHTTSGSDEPSGMAVGYLGDDDAGEEAKNRKRSAKAAKRDRLEREKEEQLKQQAEQQAEQEQEQEQQQQHDNHAHVSETTSSSSSSSSSSTSGDLGERQITPEPPIQTQARLGLPDSFSAPSPSNGGYGGYGYDDLISVDPSTTDDEDDDQQRKEDGNEVIR